LQAAQKPADPRLGTVLSSSGCKHAIAEQQSGAPTNVHQVPSSPSPVDSSMRVFGRLAIST
jgi:hypothetical protein